MNNYPMGMAENLENPTVSRGFHWLPWLRLVCKGNARKLNVHREA